MTVNEIIVKKDNCSNSKAIQSQHSTNFLKSVQVLTKHIGSTGNLRNGLPTPTSTTATFASLSNKKTTHEKMMQCTCRFS